MTTQNRQKSNANKNPQKNPKQIPKKSNRRMEITCYNLNVKGIG